MDEFTFELALCDRCADVFSLFQEISEVMGNKDIPVEAFDDLCSNCVTRLEEAYEEGME